MTEFTTRVKLNCHICKRIGPSIFQSGVIGQQIEAMRMPRGWSWLCSGIRMDSRGYWVGNYGSPVCQDCHRVGRGVGKSSPVDDGIKGPVRIDP